MLVCTHINKFYMKNYIIDNQTFNQIETWLMNFKDEVLTEIEKLNNLQNDDETYYTTDQTADILGISKKTLYNLNNTREITYSKAAGKCFYSKKNVKDFLQRNTYKSKYEIKVETLSNIIR